MKRKWLLGITVIVLLAMLTGCRRNGEETGEGKTAKPVAVMELKEEIYPITLHYTGTIESKDLKKYSFKTSGKIAELFVEEGQPVRKGDKLALLEQEELKFSLDAAKAQMEAAKAQYNKGFKGARNEEIDLQELDVHKAEAYYDFVKDYYGKIEALNESGAVSQQNFNEAKLKLDQAKDSLEQAKKVLQLTKDGIRDEEIEVLLKQYEMAKANYEAAVKLLEDSLITADFDGYVVSVLSKENEIASAGYPVVVVSSNAYKGRIGLTQEDVSKIKMGDEVDVFINNQKIKGMITVINKIPDEESRTYMTDISLDSTKEINIGTIVKVVITVEEEKGIRIPIQYLLNDGEDYVLTVEDSRVKRKNVKLKSIQEEKVWVEGLKEGEILITEGMKSVKEGYEIVIDSKKQE